MFLNYFVFFASLAVTVQGVTYNRITAANVAGYWLELGFANLDDTHWEKVATKTNNFTDAVIFASLPDVPGESTTPSAGVAYPTSIRIQNNALSSGYVSFQMRIYLTNDSYCVKTWYTPIHISGTLSVSWMVVEKGAYLLNGYYFNALSGTLTRSAAALVSGSSDFQVINFPYGCGSSTTQCVFPQSISTASMGAIAQLQDFVYTYFMMVRCSRLRRADITLVLTPHDASDSTYYVLSTPTTVGIFVFQKDIQIRCVEGLSFETTRITGVTSTIKTFTYSQTYDYTPGIYGLLLTQNSLVDSTGLRAPTRTTTNAEVITQEDQCVDEETDHTTSEEVGLLVVGQTSVATTLVCFVKYTSAFAPTSIPTSSPSGAPSKTPTFSPSRNPTVKPSSSPTTSPSSAPSSSPSVNPTRSPTTNPSAAPSSSPSSSPSSAPSSSPSRTPTSSPSAGPTTSSPTSTCSANTFTVTMTKSA